MIVLRLNIYLNSETLSVTTAINIHFNSVINISKGLFLTSVKSPGRKQAIFKQITTGKVIRTQELAIVVIEA